MARFYVVTLSPCLWARQKSPPGNPKMTGFPLRPKQQIKKIVGEGQTEENHSGKGETRIGGAIRRVSWTVDMACD